VLVLYTRVRIEGGVGVAGSGVGVLNGETAKRDSMASEESWSGFLVTGNVVSSSPIVNLITEAIFPSKRRLLQESHCVTSQKTTFFNIIIFRERKQFHGIFRNVGRGTTSQDICLSGLISKIFRTGSTNVIST
jgi:hypothetical protein